VTALEVIRAARAKIERPECWLGGHPSPSAEDENGIGVSPDSGQACRWCAFGALESLVRYSGEYEAWKAVTAQVDGMLTVWNDTPGRTHWEVLAAFDRAIASLESNA